LRQPVEGPDSDLAMFCERLLKVIDNPAAHGYFQDEIHKRTAPVSLKPLEKSESRDSVRI
jgi:hypothetical protein